jgi:L-alanine-DL-glutamate epimerase-like enolase superfamily enzyme
MQSSFPDQVKIEELYVSAFTVPTDAPESDGTLEWDKTTMVLVELRAGGTTGLGYTYADVSTAVFVRQMLAETVKAADPMNIPAVWETMLRQSRNFGQTGIAAMGISAVDTALWDLKSKLLNVPLVSLLGAVRAEAPIYGSGGFTSYSDQQLQRQFGEWVEQGIPRVKMKVGRDPEIDPKRVALARRTIGSRAELFVDANSAYDLKTAFYFTELFAEEFDVRWMEQPLAPEDRQGMRFLRERRPAKVEIADGEYGYGPSYFREMIDSGAVDVVMADATRCCGISGFLKAAAICETSGVPLSSHCAPVLHLHPGCASAPFRHAEYFHDHVRIERMFFDGFPEPVNGALKPDLSTPGLGVAFRQADAEPYRQSF